MDGYERPPLLKSRSASQNVSKDEFINEIKNSRDCNYYVISSPTIGRKSTDYGRASFSYIKTNSEDTSSEESGYNSVPITEPHPRNTRAVLECEKRKLLDRIVQIEYELSVLNAEERILLNLRDVISKCSSKINTVQRNKQGLPSLEKIKDICGKFYEELKSNDADTEVISRLKENQNNLVSKLDSLKNMANKVSQQISVLDVPSLEKILSLMGYLYGIIDVTLELYYTDDWKEVDVEKNKVFIILTFYF